MKRTSTAAVALAVGICGLALDLWPINHPGFTSAFSETLAQAEPPVSSERTINLTQENRFVIREIILKDPNFKKVLDDVNVSIGDLVPDGITTQPFPSDVSQKIPQLKSHLFFVKGDVVIVVDPKTNKVADIVK